jgi:hypothetical protein
LHNDVGQVAWQCSTTVLAAGNQQASGPASQLDLLDPLDDGP